jgi:hypothetical protein
MSGKARRASLRKRLKRSSAEYIGVNAAKKKHGSGRGNSICKGPAM